MDKGMEFLRSQVNNAVVQHRALVQALEDHESQADDPRYRELCSRYLPIMREHQTKLENYQHTLGAQEGVTKKITGLAAGLARDLADVARGDDFLRLVGDIVMARQSEDTFKTFREAGRALGNQQLADVGDAGERQHDAYIKDANRLVQAMFIEHVRDTGAERRAEASHASEQRAP
jgi:hypothetical protein